MVNVTKDSEVFRVFIHSSTVHQDVGRAGQARRSSADAWTAHWSRHYHCQAVRSGLQGVHLCVFLPCILTSMDSRSGLL